jgi:hypothetical protein
MAYDQRMRTVSFVRRLSSPIQATYIANIMERTQDRSGWSELSPFAATPRDSQLPQLVSDEPVRCLLVEGERDDGSWGIVGAFWISASERHGGFFISPTAIWHGSEMARSFRGALERGWTEKRIFSYWEDLSGQAESYKVGPTEDAGSLFEVARRVGAL